MVDYDEFGLFHENAEEFGLPFDGPPVVRRESVAVAPDGRRLSALVWGTAAARARAAPRRGPERAHLGHRRARARPPARRDRPPRSRALRPPRRGSVLSPRENAVDVAVAIRALAPDARMVVGMSLGGLTTIALRAHAPELVRKVALVDVTPGVDRDKAAPIAQFIAGPESFESFDEILDRTVEFNPTRSESSLRRGVLHNAIERDDGRWVWRYQRPRPGETRRDDTEDIDVPADFATLWDDVSADHRPADARARGGGGHRRRRRRRGRAPRAATRRRGSSSSRARGTASRATSRSSSPRCSPTSSTAEARAAGARSARRGTSSVSAAATTCGSSNPPPPPSSTHPGSPTTRSRPPPPPTAAPPVCAGRGTRRSPGMHSPATTRRSPRGARTAGSATWRRLEPLDPAGRAPRARARRWHTVAEHVVAPARHRANGKIGLRFTRGGFGTPFFRTAAGVDEQVRVDGGELVVVRGADRRRVADHDVAARGRGGRHRARRAARRVHAQHTARSRRAACRRRARRDRAGRLVRVRVLGARGAPGRCGSAPRTRRACSCGPSTSTCPSTSATTARGGRGARSARRPATTSTPSPTSTSRTGPSVPDDPFWNDHAFAGASLAYSELLAAPDQRAAALDFFGRADPFRRRCRGV